VLFRGGTDAAIDAITGGNAINDTKWLHIVVVGNSTSSNDATFYVDGVAQTTSYRCSFSALPSGDATRNLAIGALKSATFTLPVNGQLDDVRIYNRNLSASEVQTLYKMGSLYK
jgi:hypothetical protein